MSHDAERPAPVDGREGLVVRSARGGDYEVAVDDEVWLCRLRGKVKAAGRAALDRVVVGDRVVAVRSEDELLPGEPERGYIEERLPRHSLLARGRPNKPPQPLIANVDQLLVVMAARQPMLSLHAADRFLAIAWVADVEARLVLNKTDLDRRRRVERAARQIYEPLGVEVIATSVDKGVGLDALAAALAGRVSVVMGPSGAGKSSLLNTLNPGYALRTGEVMSIGKGRHTTTETRLLPLDGGGYVADTPGIKTLQLIAERVELDALETLFPEIELRAPECRFSDCIHIDEPGCAVKEAVEQGDIAASRYDSYVRLYAEVEEAQRQW